MSTDVKGRANVARRGWVLVSAQLLIVAAYAYAVIVYVTSAAGYTPEQSPPDWSWPAAIVVGAGFVPAALSLAVALSRLASARWRAQRSAWIGLAVSSALTGLMLVVMATPPGWELFDWYVG